MQADLSLGAGVVHLITKPLLPGSVKQRLQTVAQQRSTPAATDAAYSLGQAAAASAIEVCIIYTSHSVGNTIHQYQFFNRCQQLCAVVAARAGGAPHLRVTYF
jgi:hypothetical protein